MLVVIDNEIKIWNFLSLLFASTLIKYETFYRSKKFQKNFHKFSFKLLDVLEFYHDISYLMKRSIFTSIYRVFVRKPLEFEISPRASYWNFKSLCQMYTWNWIRKQTIFFWMVNQIDWMNIPVNSFLIISHNCSPKKFQSKRCHP